MRLEQQLAQFEDIPVRHGTVASLLRDYKRPNDKISTWLQDGVLISVKRGLYIVNPSLTRIPISLPLIANSLYRPSYVSLEYALSHYGLIPEAVHQVTSVTTARSKTYKNQLGRFSYQTLPANAYRHGVRSVKNDSGHFYLMASPEKALCDMLMLTSNLKIYSVSGLIELFELDWRIDIDEVMHFDRNLIREITQAGFKHQVLAYLLKLLG